MTPVSFFYGPVCDWPKLLKRWSRIAIVATVTACATILGSAHAAPGKILIFTHTTGYRHVSIEAASAAISDIARERGWCVEISGDPARFDAPLDDVAAITLVSTTSRRGNPETEWFVDDRAKALKAFVNGGGGVVALHGAADSHYSWPWYGRMIGARFARHPEGTPMGEIVRASSQHPAIAHLPERFAHRDEWYWLDDVATDVVPLLSLDPRSIGESDTALQPLSWARAFDGGRVFYSALGHTSEAWNAPWLRQHIAGGLDWVSGDAPPQSCK